MPTRIYWIILGAALALGGCSHKKEHAPPPDPMLYSPNGEPLNGGVLGKVACEDGLSRWFERVDTDRNGVIGPSEFMADAQAQFIRMDIDKNGYLVSEEIERFRAPYHGQPATYALPPAVGANAAQSPPPHKRGAAHGGQSGDFSSRSDSTASGDTPDPVMAADTNLDFKVTPEEFMIHAQKIFSELDSNHDGVLSREEVLASCPAKP